MSAPQRVLIKVGGAILDDVAARAAFAASVASTVAEGNDVVVVHGGGGQVTRLTDALGLVPRRVRGLRVTDRDTALAVLQVLGGEVNAVLVDALQRALADHGVIGAVGLTGADGGLLRADVLDPQLGHVGVVRAVKADVLTRLAGAGMVPVVATVVPPVEPDAPFLNVNADDAVAPIAEAWAADVVLFLSDVPHVLAGGSRVPSLDRASVEALEEDGTISGGMIPKVYAALDAAERRPDAVVKIAAGHAGKRHGVTQPVIAAALAESSGTRFAARTNEVTHA